MEHDYNFWADLMTTYRSNPDWLKLAWAVTPTVLLTLTGYGLSRLTRALVMARAPKPKAFRSWYDEQGVLYVELLEELPERERPKGLPWEKVEKDRTSGD